MKYKVGDKVRIKSLDWYNENKDSKHGYVNCGNGIGFYKHMTEYCGKVMTISQIWNHSYEMEDHVSNWNDEMIEGLAEDVNVSEFKHSQDTIMKMLLQGTINLPEGYIFKDENGNIINATKIVLEKKEKEYPKTYEECCEIMDCAVHPYITADESGITSYYEDDLNCKVLSFRKLLICRDAYWKIAGEEMGLGKPWEPSDSDYITGRYCIFVHRGNIICDTPTQDCILTFPTPEMRDAFYENFKELIEAVKELL